MEVADENLNAASASHTKKHLQVEFLVEKIINKRTINKNTQYCLKWKNTWEPAENVKCNRLIKEFEKKCNNLIHYEIEETQMEKPGHEQTREQIIKEKLGKKSLLSPSMIKQRRMVRTPKRIDKVNAVAATNKVEFLVEKVIDKRTVNDITQYYLKWKNTWESAKNIKCNRLIEEFEKKCNNIILHDEIEKTQVRRSGRKRRREQTIKEELLIKSSPSMIKQRRMVLPLEKINKVKEAGKIIPGSSYGEEFSNEPNENVKQKPNILIHDDILKKQTMRHSRSRTRKQTVIKTNSLSNRFKQRRMVLTPEKVNKIEETGKNTKKHNVLIHDEIEKKQMRPSRSRTCKQTVIKSNRFKQCRMVLPPEKINNIEETGKNTPGRSDGEKISNEPDGNVKQKPNILIHDEIKKKQMRPSRSRTRKHTVFNSNRFKQRKMVLTPEEVNKVEAADKHLPSKNDSGEFSNKLNKEFKQKPNCLMLDEITRTHKLPVIKTNFTRKTSSSLFEQQRMALPSKKTNKSDSSDKNEFGMSEGKISKTKQNNIIKEVKKKQEVTEHNSDEPIVSSGLFNLVAGKATKLIFNIFNKDTK